MLRATLLILPVALLVACSPSSPDDTAGNASANAGQTAPAGLSVDPAQLAANHWLLSSASTADNNAIDVLFPNEEKPLQLDFLDERISISGGCNQHNGSYSLNGQTLSIGQLASTQRACAQELMDADQAIAGQLARPLQVQALDSGQLLLVSADGASLSFRAEPTARTRFGGEGETVFLEVAPQTKPCDHPLMADAQCLQTRQILYSEAGLKQGEPGEFAHFHGEIEGYEHRPGVRNVLRVKRYTIANPPADGSSLAYVLDMVVENEDTTR